MSTKEEELQAILNQNNANTETITDNAILDVVDTDSTNRDGGTETVNSEVGGEQLEVCLEPEFVADDITKTGTLNNVIVQSESFLEGSNWAEFQEGSAIIVPRSANHAILFKDLATATAYMDKVGSIKIDEVIDTECVLLVLNFYKPYKLKVNNGLIK